LRNDYQLTIGSLLKQTIYRRGTAPIVYGKIRYSWSELYDRVNALAAGLNSIGVGRGSRVAVVDIDTNRYLEMYYAIPMMGAILHTVNVRLPPEQIAYTITHAEDDVVMVRDEFLPIATKIHPLLKSVKAVVTMSDSGSAPSAPFPNTHYYEDLAKSRSHFEFPELDENTRATLFYTSGTTGLPKGVTFTHRQLVLHTLGIAAGLADSAVKIDSSDVLMPLVPFFHVHAWGFPYLAGMWGMKVVLVGKYEPKNILENLKNENVTFSDMVPTILNLVFNHADASQYREAFSRWKVVIGGAALPKELALTARRFGITVMTGYGLSETAPVLTLGTPKDEFRRLPEDQLLDQVLLRAGVPIPLVEIRVVDQNMKDVPRDGKALGEVVVRAPWTTEGYYKEPERSEALWSGGWMHTGDLASLDERGHLIIKDRLKDVVKSGGEWISTLLLEDLLTYYPAVLEAAVLGAKDSKWGERPVAVVSLKPGMTGSEKELKTHLERFVEQGKIPKFWIPDKILISEAPLPKTSTGKLDKKPLRELYANVLVK
jgi:acyl-CoA synthetase (AMP-forming)/AMP-acid ligase II